MGVQPVDSGISAAVAGFFACFGASMRQAGCGLIFTAVLFAGPGLGPEPCFAGPLADRKLLEILEKKGFLNREEVEAVREVLLEEEGREAKKGEKEVEVVLDEGLRVRTKDQKSFTTRIGGALQADWIMFDSHYPVDDDFDIRRARLFLTGRVYEHFVYKIEAELEGSSSNRLIDAYVNFDCFPWIQLQAGQFKEPFSLEQLISDKYLIFNERSFGYYLTPGRDVGFMIHGSVLGGALQYGAGIFNGDGRDATRRGQKDDKEVTGRLVVRPFQLGGPDLLRGLQIGGSCSYARLDTSDFNFKIRTPARTQFFTVQSRAKFHITQEVDTLQRYGAELAYTCGPLLAMGEYIRNDFHDVSLSDQSRFDFDMRAWYAGFLLMLTGEQPEMKGGVLVKIRPRHDFNLRAGGWGAVGIGFRYQEFEAGRVVYNSLVNAGYSVRKAEAFTIALNWYLNSMIRLSLNYSRTHFNEPLYLGTHWKGYSYYEDTEHIWITRFQLEF